MSYFSYSPVSRSFLFIWARIVGWEAVGEEVVDITAMYGCSLGEV